MNILKTVLLLFFIFCSKCAYAQDQINESTLTNIRSTSEEYPNFFNSILQPKTQFTVNDSLKNRRITFFSKHITISDFMKSISKISNLSWSTKFQQEATIFELFQSNEQKNLEAIQIRNSENREKNVRNQQKQKIFDAISNAISRKDASFQGLTDFLKTLSSQQIDSAINSSMEPPDIISGSDQSHFHKYFYYATPFSALSQQEQTSIQNLLRNEGYSHSANNELKNLKVGLIAAMGGVRLGVIEPDGADVWVSPNISLGNAGQFDLKILESDFDSSLKKLSLIDLREMPLSLRNKKIIIDSKYNQENLSSILEMIYAQTEISICSDDFLSSRSTGQLPVFSETQYSLIEILPIIAKTFRHRIIFSNGVLLLKTITPGYDLRMEPSVDMMRRMDILCNAKEKTIEDDYFLAGSCTINQLRSIVQHHPVKHFKSGFLFRAIRYHEFLKLLASLSSEQRETAFTKDGLAYTALNSRQKTLYGDVLARGLSATSAPGEAFKPLRLYIQRKPLPVAVKASTANFSVIVTGTGEPLTMRRFALR